MSNEASEPFDLDTLLRTLDDPAEVLQKLVQMGAQQREWKAWQRLATHDYERAAEDLAEWLDDVLKNDPPPPETQAFYFALFDAEDEQGKNTFGLALSGSAFFAPFDFSWAANPSWEPEDCFAPAGILDEIYRLSKDAPRDQHEFARYTIGLAYAVIAVKVLCLRFAKRMELWQHGGRQVAVGFLGGEALLLPAPQVAGSSSAAADETVDDLPDLEDQD